MSASIPLVDLSHHLSDEAKNLRPNPLKGMYKYWGVPGLINLAGVPHPSLFPYETIKANVLVPTKFPVGHANDDRLGLMSRLWAMFNGKSAKSQISIPKYANPDDGPNAIQLSTALQYSKYRSLCLGMVDGMPAFLDFVRNFTLQVFQPAYSDFHVLANTGNTDGWTKASTILCQPGELILTEVWTYPGAVLSTWPSGVRPLPVPTDSLGMIPSELERILGGWKEDEHGGKRRPHVMYTIPIGQNPTGAIMGTRRKQEVYDICVKYDIIIVEDDPYYFLQFPDYTRKSQRSLSSHIPGTVSPESSRRFIDTLEPSYLKYDITILHKPISSLVPGLITKVELSDLTHSRRLTIGPGCRLGWTTCNPLFAHVMVDYGACKTNQASGISQALVIQLVSKEWGYDGIGAQYTRRRNFMVDCFFDHLALQLTENHALSQTGATVYDARTKPFGYLDHGFEEKFPSNDQALFSFSVPNSGMFLWIKVHLKHHRDWVPHPAPGSALEFKLWTDLAEAGVIVAPGYMFSTEDEDMPAPSVSKAHSRAEYAHMRVSFSSATDEDTKKGIDTFVEVVLKFFR